MNFDRYMKPMAMSDPGRHAALFDGLPRELVSHSCEHTDSQRYRGKRVAVIGTGPTAVQIITEIARKVAHLTVFQRTPNYCAPLRNAPGLRTSTGT